MEKGHEARAAHIKQHCLQVLRMIKCVEAVKLVTAGLVTIDTCVYLLPCVKSVKVNGRFPPTDLSLRTVLHQVHKALSLSQDYLPIIMNVHAQPC